ncbi:MAG: alkaline phosphatase family protein [Nanoarchaeota archaeon]|nr:alkaline phosphatase family protein [Nanoarchaeota archaeon]MBU1643836.1 alkaline phosphatase family protein [Nanoarchaeota archaeon]
MACAIGLTNLECSMISPSNFPQNSKRIEKLLLLGIDGLRPDALIKAQTPNLDSLVKNGAYSYKAQAEYPTWSGHGWSDILTGVTSRKHGVRDNTFVGSNYEEYPDFLTRLESLTTKFNTASLVSWTPINEKIIQTADKKIYYPYFKNGDELVMEEAVKILDLENPDALFVYFADVDVIGHRYGFHPDISKYLAQIEIVDMQVGKVLEALKSRTTYNNENWLVMATTDHGGTRAGHGGNKPKETTVFYIANGLDVVPGEIVPAPRHVDIVPTIFKHLKVPIDSSWKLDGKPIALR